MLRLIRFLRFDFFNSPAIDAKNNLDGFEVENEVLCAEEWRGESVDRFLLVVNATSTYRTYRTGSSTSSSYWYL